MVMYSYLATGPLALVVPSVYDDAKAFKAAYERLWSEEGEGFPFTRLMGRGERLNHAHFPDLYYCAVSSSKRAGALGGKAGNFSMSNLPTKADSALLDKVCRHASADLELSDSNLARWKTAAEEMGASVSDQDLKRVKRKLRRDDNSDTEEDAPSRKRQSSAM